MLAVENLRHHYRRAETPAVDGLTVEIAEGVTALVGANGAGKSTFVRMVGGGLRPTSGTVRLGDLDPYGRWERREALRRVALMPQTAGIPRGLKAREFIAYLTWMRGVPRAEAADRAAEALVQVGLEKRADSKLGSLSGGMVRRVWLAQALAAKADVLLLDEPSTGLDPRQRATMVELVRERARGTVLLSSHLIEDVVSLADRVLVLEAGRIVFDGPVEQGMDAAWLLSLIRDGDV